VHAYGSPGQVPPLDTLPDLVLVITDYEMPEENGLAFADRFHTAHPCVPVVLLTAHRAATLAAPLRTRRFVYLCNKPFDADEFCSLLETVLSPES
jgi:DNA-binding NtrC family response regulator